MGKLIYGIGISLDDCCDHTKFSGGNDIHDYFRKLLEKSDTVAYGRKTYELMIPFWPQAAKVQSMDESANAFASVFTRLSRVVVSRTMEASADPQARVIAERVREEILELKQLPETPSLPVVWNYLES